jgi:hypothetical protein
MPRISHEHKQLYKSKIRSLLARNHQATQIELVEGMEKAGFKLDRFYLSKLVKEIHAERIRRADRQTLNFALASFEDTMIEVVRLVWEIANIPYISAQARVMALREIFNLGVEGRDDLCDGVTTLLQGLVEQGLDLPKIHWIET